ncbi:MAG: hypothetical protein E6J50_07370, partial [Chloroflexi bacterium]
MLIDVVEIADRDDSFGDNRLVVGLDGWGDARDAQRGRGLGTETDELRKTFIRWWGGLLIPAQDRFELIVDLLDKSIGQAWILVNAGGKPAG